MLGGSDETTETSTKSFVDIWTRSSTDEDRRVAEKELSKNRLDSLLKDKHYMNKLPLEGFHRSLHEISVINLGKTRGLER